MESLFATVWQTPDWVWHEVRRFAARTVASHHGRRPEVILLVCHGNVCRSPFATVILGRWLAPARISVTSAGFVGPSRKSPADAIHAAHRRGVNLTTHRSRVLDSTLVRNADLVVTMDAAQAREIRRRFRKPLSQILVLGDFDPDLSEGRAIADPFGRPPTEYDRVYARIERCAAGLAEAVMRSRSVRAEDGAQPHA